ncbi:putative repeat protein (TIGR01451 family)/fimbrial isopeptide formation D2 family protein [Arcanobacterium pluranimalium]|uniref:SdrD B-like domain-containing protein n=1 Tax=Arcanobacterium pluranimalium TaxID=108028 RepID=UPI00195C602D|nr:SdrD B-like domain-containing protein [Arcanobacterium pluranimalium]MBM7824341.1 putative repeat protein (TIGR01451 family)/fimbrial isopeptide formation D2 family protein [Arcanobacterium pluranimalium]
MLKRITGQISAKFLALIVSLLLLFPVGMAQGVGTNGAIDLLAGVKPAGTSTKEVVGGAQAAGLGELVEVSATASFPKAVEQREYVRPDGSFDATTFVHLNVSGLENWQNLQLFVNDKPVAAVMADPAASTAPGSTVHPWNASSWVIQNLGTATDPDYVAYAPLGAVAGLEAGGTVKFAVSGVVPTTAKPGSVIDVSSIVAGYASGTETFVASPEVGKVGVADPKLAVSKSATPADSVAPGSTVTYNVNVSTSGGSAFGVQVVDTLPAGVTVVNAGGGKFDAAANTLTFAMGDLASGGSRQVTYSVKVGDSASGVLANTATASGYAAPEVAGVSRVALKSVSATASVSVTGKQPSISVSSASDLVRNGGDVDYMIDVLVPAGTTLNETTVMAALPQGTQAIGKWHLWTRSVTIGDGTTQTPLSYEQLSAVDLGSVRNMGWYFAAPIAPAATDRHIQIKVTFDVFGNAGDQVVLPVALGANPAPILGQAKPDPRAWPDYTYNAKASDPVTIGSIIIESVPVEPATTWVPERNSATPKKIAFKVTNKGNLPATELALRRSADAEPFIRFTSDRTTDATLVPNPRVKETYVTGHSAWFYIIDSLAPGETVTIERNLDAPINNTYIGHEDKNLVNFWLEPQWYGPYGNGAVSLQDNLPYQRIFSKEAVTISYPKLTFDAQIEGSSTFATIDHPTFTYLVTNPGDAPMYDPVINLKWSGTAGDWGQNHSITAKLPNGTTVAGAITYNGAGNPTTVKFNGVRIGPGETLTVTDLVGTNTFVPGGWTLDADVNAADSFGARYIGSTNQYWLTGQDSLSGTIGKVTLVASKLPTDTNHGTIVSGKTSEYALTIRNSGTVDATNVSISDSLPAHLTYAESLMTGGVPQVNVRGTSAVPTVSLVSGSTTAKKWLISSIPAGTSVTLTIPVQHDGSTPVANEVAASNSVVESAYDPAQTVTGYLDVLPFVIRPSVVKTADKTHVIPGDTITYTVDITLPAGQTETQYGLSLIDKLPRGVKLVSQSDLSVVAGAQVVAQKMTTTDNAVNGISTIGWNLGTWQANAPVSTVLRGTYTVQVDKYYTGSSELLTPPTGTIVTELSLDKLGGNLVNSAGMWWSSDSAFTAPAAAPEVANLAGYTGRSEFAVAKVNVDSPDLTVTKTVDAQVWDPGDTATFTVKITNKGDLAATNVLAHDDLGSSSGTGYKLTDVAVASVTGGTATVANGKISIAADSIPAGGTLTLVYTAKMPVSGDLKATYINGTPVHAKVVNQVTIDSFTAPNMALAWTNPITASVTTYVRAPYYWTYDVNIEQCQSGLTKGQAAGLSFTATIGNHNFGASMSPQQGTAYDSVMTLQIPIGISVTSVYVGSPLNKTFQVADVLVSGDGSTTKQTLKIPLGDVPTNANVSIQVAGVAAKDITAYGFEQASFHLTWKDSLGSVNYGANVGTPVAYVMDGWSSCYKSMPNLNTTYGPQTAKPGATVTFNGTFMSNMFNVSGNGTFVDTFPADVTYVPGSANLVDTSTGKTLVIGTDVTETITTVGTGVDAYQVVTWKILPDLPEKSAITIAVNAVVDADAKVANTVYNNMSVYYDSMKQFWSDGTLRGQSALYILDPKSIKLDGNITPNEVIAGQPAKAELILTVPAMDKLTDVAWNVSTEGDYFQAGTPTLECVSNCSDIPNLPRSLSWYTDTNYNVVKAPGSTGMLYTSIKFNNIPITATERVFKLSYDYVSRDPNSVANGWTPHDGSFNSWAAHYVAGALNSQSTKFAYIISEAAEPVVGAQCSPSVVGPVQAGGAPNVTCTYTVTNPSIKATINSYTLVADPREQSVQQYPGAQSTIGWKVVDAGTGTAGSDATVRWNDVTPLKPGESRSYTVKYIVDGISQAQPVDYYGNKVYQPATVDVRVTDWVLYSPGSLLGQYAISRTWDQSANNVNPVINFAVPSLSIQQGAIMPLSRDISRPNDSERNPYGFEIDRREHHFQDLYTELSRYPEMYPGNENGNSSYRPAVEPEAMMVTPGKAFTMATAIDVAGASLMNSMQITAKLPAGFTYVPGSAHLIDPIDSYSGSYGLGKNSAGQYIELRSGNVVPAFKDPTVGAAVKTTCTSDHTDPSDLASVNTGGEALSWQLTPADLLMDPYYNQFAADISHKILIYDVMPAPSLADCVNNNSYVWDHWSTFKDFLTQGGADPSGIDYSQIKLRVTAFTTEANGSMELLDRPGDPMLASDTDNVTISDPLNVNSGPDDAPVKAGSAAAAFEVTASYSAGNISPDLTIIDTIDGAANYKPGTATAIDAKGTVVALTEEIISQTATQTVVKWTIKGTTDQNKRTYQGTGGENALSGNPAPVVTLVPSSVKIRIPVEIPTSTPEGTKVTNTAQVTSHEFTSPLGALNYMVPWYALMLNDQPEQYYTYSMMPFREITKTDVGSLIVRNPSAPPVITMKVDPTVAPGGTYTVSGPLALPANLAWSSAYVLFTVPARVEVTDAKIDVCESGANYCTDLAKQVKLWDPVKNADGTTTYGYWLGDIGASGDVRTLSNTFKLHTTNPDGTPSVVAGDQLPVKATVYSDTDAATGTGTAEVAANLLGSLTTGGGLLPSGFGANTPAPITTKATVTPPTTIPTAPPSSTYFPPAVSNGVTVVGEPKLAITKSTPTPQPVALGGRIDYVVTVTNNGTAPAYGIALTDKADQNLVNVWVDDLGGMVLRKGWTAAAPWMELRAPVIDPGQTLTVTYHGTVSTAIDQSVSIVDHLTNTVQLGDFASQPAPYPTGTRIYPGSTVGTQTTTVKIAAPGVAIATNTGAQCDNPVAIGAPNQTMHWCSTITVSPQSALNNVVPTVKLPSGWTPVAGSYMVSQVMNPGDTPTLTPVTPVYDAATQTLTFPQLASMPAGSSLRFVFDATPSTNAEAQGTMVTSVTASTPSGLNISDSQPTAYTLVGTDLGVVKTPAMISRGFTGAAGADVVWKVVVSNTSSVDQTNVHVVDTLPGKTGVGNVTMKNVAVVAAGGASTPAPATVTAGADGREVLTWDIASLPAGSQVEFTVTGTISALTTTGIDVVNWTNDVQAMSNLVTTAVVAQAKFELLRGATIANTIWDDLNGNGIQDAGEPGLAGVEVQLTKDGQAVTDVNGNPVLTAVTDADGNYRFADLLAGTYHVAVVQPAGVTLTDTGKGTDKALDSDGITFDVTVANGQVESSFDTGMYKPGNVSGVVWKDANGDGIRDASEEIFAGVTITLLDGTGKPVLDASGNPVSVISGADGSYTLTIPRPGDYTLEFKTPDGWMSVPVHAGTDTAIDSDGPLAGLSVISGAKFVNVDAGFKPVPVPPAPVDPTPTPVNPAPVPVPVAPTPVLEPEQPAAEAPAKGLARTGSQVLGSVLGAMMMVSAGMVLAARRRKETEV